MITISRSGYEKLVRDPLYRNSFFVGASRLINVAVGFVFWNIAARHYSVEDVGLATALISSLCIVVALSRFGFDTSIIRFMPSSDKNKVFNTCFWITSAFSIVLSIIYLMAVEVLSPSTSFIQDYAVLFISAVMLSSAGLTIGSAFISLRMGGHYLLQKSLLAVRLPTLIPLSLWGSMGIFVSVGLADLVSLFPLYYIAKVVKFRPDINMDFAKDSFSFSFSNHLATIFDTLPFYIIPIIVLNQLGAKEAAIYYIAFSVSNIVHIVPEAISMSLFVEGSHGTNLRRDTMRALASTYLLLIPSVIFVYLFGDLLLGLFGRDYANAFDLLKIFVIAGLLNPIITIFIPLQNIQLKVRNVVIVNFIKFFLMLVMTYIFTLKFGIMGTGYSLMATLGMISILIGYLVFRNGWIKR